MQCIMPATSPLIKCQGSPLLSWHLLLPRWSKTVQKSSRLKNGRHQEWKYTGIINTSFWTCWQNKLGRMSLCPKLKPLNQIKCVYDCCESKCKRLYACVTCVLFGNNPNTPLPEGIIFLELLVMMFRWRPSGSAPFVSAQTQCIVFVTIHPHSSVWYPLPPPSLALAIFLCLLSFH